jgi:hypothetical protein
MTAPLPVGFVSPPGQETQDDRHAGAVGSQATCGVAAPTEWRQKTTTGAGNVTMDLRGAHGNRQESLNRIRETTERRAGGMASRRKMADGARHECHYENGRP